MNPQGRDRRRPRGPTAFDPALDALRLPESDLCRWCGDLATTREHRIKHSTLRRVAGSGLADGQVFKVSDNYSSTLHSLRKGSQVQWPKNLCGNCNSSRSQPFDRAHDVMEDFIVEHADEMARWPRLSWSDVYGDDWQQEATDLARYFGKQMGCMLAGQRLPVPDDLIEFLDGAPRCPSIAFVMFRNWRAGSFHRFMRRDGSREGITTFVGLLPSTALHDGNGRFTGVDYGYHIGYLWFCAQWLEGSDRSSWWEYPEIELPLLNGSVRDRIAWKLMELRQRRVDWSAMQDEDLR